MDDDIDLENELLQEQSLYELTFGEEVEHDLDSEHLQQHTTNAYGSISSLIPDKTDPIEINRSVYAQDTSSAIEDNLDQDPTKMKAYTRFYDMHR